MTSYTKHPEELKGEFYMILEILVGSFLPVAMHYGSERLPQIQFLALITLIAAVFFLGICVWTKKLRTLFQVGLWPKLLSYTLLVGVIPYAIIFYASRFSTANEIALLSQTETVFAIIIGAFFLKEKMPLKKLIGAAFLLCSSILVLRDGLSSWNPANLWIAVAPLSFVFGNMIAKKLQRDGVTWHILLSFRSLMGGLILLGVSLIFETRSFPSLSWWPFLIAFSFFFFVLMKILWQLALHRLDLSKATALLMCMPPLTMLISYFLLKEVPSLPQVLGLVLTLIGAYFLFRSPSKQWENVNP